MTKSDVQGASRPSRRLTILSVGMWGLLAFGLPLAALTLNAFKVAGFPLGFLTTAVFVLIGLAALATFFALRARGEDRQEGIKPSLRLAGEALGSAGVLGAVGAIAALGYDGLAFPLGIAAGLALMAILVAPRFSLYPVRSIAGFMTVRYGGHWPRRIALAVVLLSSIVLLAADLRGGALAVQGIFATDYASGLASMAVLLGVVWLLRSFYEVPFGRGAVFVVLLVFVFVPVFALPVYQGRLPLPLFLYGYGIQDLATLEQSLIMKKLANFEVLRPMAAPFLRYSMVNFAGFVLALGLGLAALPYLLGRHISQAHVTPGAAPKRVALSMVWVVWFLLALAAFAVFERIGVDQTIAKGIETAAVPQALLDGSGRGWLSLCGIHSSSAVDVAAACAQASGNRGFLRLQDVGFTSDSFALSAPWISGLPPYLFWTFWLAVGLAALVTGHAIIAGLLSADGEGRRGGSVDARAMDARSIIVAVVALFAGLLIALVSQLEIPQLFADGLALVASGLFPALLLGLFWRHMNGAGAVAAMLSGFVIAGLYIVAVRYFPVHLFDLAGAWSDAPPGAVDDFEALKAAYTSAGVADKSAAWSALWQQASEIASIKGLKPPAISLIAVPVGLLVGVSVSLLASLASSGGRSAGIGRADGD